MGGFLESKESFEEGVRREILEEIGVEITIKRLLGSYPDTYGRGIIRTINVFFVATLRTGNMKPASNVSEIRWFPHDETPKMVAFDCVRRALHDWQRQKTP